MKKHILLFLAANPPGTDRLAVDREVRAIQEELERSGHGDWLELETRWAVLLFGHKSFREFLVGRHWAITLRRLVRDGHGADSGWTTSLLEGRLLGGENNGFRHLMQLINATETSSARPAAPLGWRDEERRQLVRWAQETFENERQDFAGHARSRTRGDTALRNDRRAELREAALAIGSMTRGSTGLRANDPRALRSMLAWFWANGEAAIILAPRVALAGADLAQAVLRRADLRGADLGAADLSGANLSEADLREADLRAAQLAGADLRGADLRAAKLGGANLAGARLAGTDLRGADLHSAKLPKADLAGADLGATILRGADLRGADLRTACLRDAELQQADLAGADLSATDLNGVDFGGSKLTGAIFRGADLSGARLARADLREAKLGGADLLWADLLGTDLRKAEWDAATLWPLGFQVTPARR